MCHAVVVGICVSRLVLHNDLFWLCKSFSLMRLTVSSGVFGHPDPFLLHKQPSSLNFLCNVKIYIAIGGYLENSLTNVCMLHTLYVGVCSITVLFDCDRAYSNIQCAFSLPVKGI